ncbi:MAG: FHA domain-containing protein [Ktedonobacteraceae bacterium]|nr:FHA domain-containing protein [Ktedonobacteraceae bacterium]MBO0795755.1 FHA domain-containing protein [Ktedonobacteraceae bacterium]
MAQEHTSGAYLVIRRGKLAGKRVELWKECTTIGRSRDCDIFLEDITVHRKQASILRTPEGYVLRDDHGSGDSFVNGQPVVQLLLHNGDDVVFGNTDITFYASEGTRPFQLPMSRGRELLIGKPPSSSACLVRSDGGCIELLPHMTIGRSRECDIFLEDLTVSRLHATIRELENGEFELIDNHSATGIFINGYEMKHTVLQEGDVVQIGANRFIFRR